MSLNNLFGYSSAALAIEFPPFFLAKPKQLNDLLEMQ